MRNTKSDLLQWDLFIGYVGQTEDGLSKAWEDYETFAKMEGTD